MKLNYFKKNLIDYLILGFLISSFYLYLNEAMIGLSGYYVLIFVVLIVLKFSKQGFVGLCSLYLGEGQKKKNLILFIFFILSLIVTSNILSFFIQSRFLNEGYAIKEHFDSHYLYIFLIFNTVRIFGEEFVFRGFLLIDDIRKNNRLFWLLNLSQAALFSFIHSIIAEELTGKLVFTGYVFLFSIFAGWINRKYNSLLPSWLIHWGNGLINFFYVL